jgi:hypothetical protein
MDNYFIWSKHGETQPRTKNIIDEREEENMNADHVYSLHDDGADQDDVGENDEGLDVEELMRNVAPDVLLQCRNKGFDNFETIKRRGTFFMRSVKGDIRSTRCFHSWLNCPIYMDDSDAYRQQHGKKVTFFDYHQRFLPLSQPFRDGKKSFMKGKIVRKGPLKQKLRADIIQMLDDLKE